MNTWLGPLHEALVDLSPYYMPDEGIRREPSREALEALVSELREARPGDQGVSRALVSGS